MSETEDNSCDSPELARDQNRVLLADTHCHFGMYRNRANILARAVDAGVIVVAATSRPSEYRDLNQRFRGTRGLEVGLGFHPECAGSVYVPYELEIFREVVKNVRWISEVGMDGVIAEQVSTCFGNKPTLGAQADLLRSVLERVDENQVLSLHSRGAESHVVREVEAHGHRRAILHYFSGPHTAATQARDAGLYFSVHPEMLKSASGREFIQWVPVDGLLFETDGPYFRFKDHQIEPRDCVSFATDVADIRNVDPSALIRCVSDNYAHLVSG